MPELEGVEHRFVNAGGLRMHVAEAGEGPPLMMLHGWPQHWWEWRELIGPLAESHRVICPDLRGFGWSDAPPGGYEPEIFARDIAALLDAMEIEEPVDLIGHDWGGWTGFILCLRHRERVRRFLALNIYHPFLRPSARGLLSTWRFWYQLVIAAPALAPRLLGGSISRVGPAVAWVGGREAGWSEEDEAIFVDQFDDPDRAMAAARLYRHSLLELSPSVARGAYMGMTLETPTLLLFGTDDRVQDHRVLPGFERNAPNMRLEVVPGAGHFIADEQPKLVLSRARDFLGIS